MYALHLGQFSASSLQSQHARCHGKLIAFEVYPNHMRRLAVNPMLKIALIGWDNIATKARDITYSLIFCRYSRDTPSLCRSARIQTHSNYSASIAPLTMTTCAFLSQPRDSWKSPLWTISPSIPAPTDRELSIFATIARAASGAGSARVGCGRWRCTQTQFLRVSTPTYRWPSMDPMTVSWRSRTPAAGPDTEMTWGVLLRTSTFLNTTPIVEEALNSWTRRLTGTFVSNFFSVCTTHYSHLFRILVIIFAAFALFTS